MHVPGAHLGVRRQQHPADLHAAVARRAVQRGEAEAVRRGHGAGVRPQVVPQRAELAVLGGQDDVAASGGQAMWVLDLWEASLKRT